MSTPLLSEVKYQIHLLGYDKNLLRENYTFDDASSPLKKDLSIALAAFAKTPPSYRNACIGVLSSNGYSGEKFVSEYRTLGAPLFFEVLSDHIRQYKVHANGAQFIESITAQDIPNVFERNQYSWSPDSIFRAKSLIQQPEPYQLDFVDIGLLPALRGMIDKKLDRLLKSIINNAVQIYKEKRSVEPDDASLFRLVFRFLAAKIFKDRKHHGAWADTDAQSIIKAINSFYGPDIGKQTILDDVDTQQAVWNKFIDAFNFQNLSVDDLAFIYENTFIQKDIRKKLGIHSTPLEIADLIVNSLPIDLLPQDDRFVLEPFAGHGIFLISSLRRLRDLLPNSWTAQKRHEYLKERLTAIEIDIFSAEVCRLCLMLADYPNPNGWNIISGDIFADNILETQLKKSQILLCNPPFENFDESERNRYGNRISSPHKPYEILRRILNQPPEMIGYIMPKSSIMGDSYKNLQQSISSIYNNVEMIMLPDNIFQFSDQETVLLIAYKKNNNLKTDIVAKTFWVGEKEKKFLFEAGQLPGPICKTISRSNYQEFTPLWTPPFAEVWDYLKDYPRLKEFAKLHRGIEWNTSIKNNRDLLISDVQKPGFKKGLDTSKGKIEAYYAHGFVYLNMEEEFRRTDNHYLQWSRPKVIVNKSRLSRGLWRMVGYPDHEGLVISQQFIGLWARDDINIDVLSAIVNSPLANAMVYFNGFGRDHQIRLLENIPIPLLYSIEANEISMRVRNYIELRSSAEILENNHLTQYMIHLLREIDGLLLQAYDLPPRMERRLLDFFNGYRRPLQLDFPDYYPPDFAPSIPLHMFLKIDFQQSSARELLKRIKPIDSPEAHRFAKNLKRWFS